MADPVAEDVWKYEWGGNDVYKYNFSISKKWSDYKNTTILEL